jgi:predicted peroxiredoxin/TusA-related sulfurtransferase
MDRTASASRTTSDEIRGPSTSRRSHAAASRTSAEDTTTPSEYGRRIRLQNPPQQRPTGSPDGPLIDGRGRSVSTAILYEVARAIRPLAPGSVITIRTDPLPAVDSDIRAWCRSTGHELLAADEPAGARDYLVRKTDEVRRQPGWAIIISNPGLEELLSPLGFALGAALAGSTVAIYFQGPAVRVLTRSFSEKLHGWQRPFSAFARRGLDEAGHPPPQVKLRQLQDLGALIYICGPSMTHFKVKADDLIFAGVQVAAYPTFVEQMNQATVQVFLQ